jgi:hypothetical protein
MCSPDDMDGCVLTEALVTRRPVETQSLCPPRTRNKTLRQKKLPRLKND